MQTLFYPVTFLPTEADHTNEGVRPVRLFNSQRSSTISVASVDIVGRSYSTQVSLANVDLGQCGS